MRLAAHVPAVNTDIILFRKGHIRVVFNLLQHLLSDLLLFTDLQAKVSLQLHVISIFDFCHVLPLIVCEGFFVFKKVITTQI